MEQILKISFILFFLCSSAYAGGCEFSCTDDQSEVLVEGKPYKCPIGQVCNRLNYTLPDNSCRRCLTLTEMCDLKYTCGSEQNEVIMGNDTLECPSNFRCSAPNPTCEPCARIYCYSRFWQCSWEDPAVFTIDNIKLECATGFVCNRYAIAPCNACIAEGDYWNVAGPLLYGTVMAPTP